MAEDEKDRIDAFLKEGLWRYQEAKSTLVTFQNELKKKFKHLLEDYRKKHSKWGSFEPDKSGKILFANPGEDYAWLSARIPGKMCLESGTKDAYVELGISWYEYNKPVFYIGYYSSKDDLKNKETEPPIEIHKEYKNRFVIIASKDSDIDASLLMLLDKFAECS